MKGNQECKAYQGHLGRRGQTARSKLLMHIKVNDRLCFLGSRYIIASGMSRSNTIFELVAVRPLWTQVQRGQHEALKLKHFHMRDIIYRAAAESLRWCIPAMGCIVSSDVAAAVATGCRAPGGGEEEEEEERERERKRYAELMTRMFHPCLLIAECSHASGEALWVICCQSVHHFGPNCNISIII